MRKSWAVIVAAVTVAGAGAVATIQGAFAQATPSYSFDPSPIHTAASPTAGETITVTLSLTDTSSPSPSPIPGATVYLSLAEQGGGLALGTASSPQCTGTGPNISKTPGACAADQQGRVTVVYKSKESPISPFGTDVLTAQDAATNPMVSATDVYVYGPSPFILPAAIASAGTLSAVP
ncbi:MAG: hypothetical protein ACYDD7_24760, partial [Acidimicrobiales bacterium]